MQKAGSVPLMTMVMLPWVAQSAETRLRKEAPTITTGVSRSPSTARSAASISTMRTLGTASSPDCNNNPPTYLTANPNDAYFPLLDQPGTSDPANSVYRSQWAAALATAFGNGTPHFYDMDNEIDIWGGTHFDIHPQQSGYDELRTRICSKREI